MTWILLRQDNQVETLSSCKEALDRRCYLFDKFNEYCGLYQDTDSGLQYELALRNSSGDSPVEKQFAAAYKVKTGRFPDDQVNIGQYRVDFLLPNNIIVEIDGHEFHSTPQQKAADARRDRYLQNQGYRVYRFTGAEINADVFGCLKELPL